MTIDEVKKLGKEKNNNNLQLLLSMFEQKGVWGR